MRFSLLAGVLSCLLGVAGAASAAIQTGDKIVLTDSIGSGPGGQFTISYVSGPGGGFTPIQVFCLETNEYIAYGGQYYVTIEPNALQGGAGGSLGAVSLPYNPGVFNPNIHGDPVGGDGPVLGDNWGDMTQWLYQSFALGQLDSAVGSYATGDVNSADALQNVIWYLQQEIGSVGQNLNAAKALIANDLLAWAASKGDYTGLNAANPTKQYDVVAMNLWGSSSNGTYNSKQQSMLMMIESERSIVEEVPEPASIAVWSLISLGGVLAFRRRAVAAM